MTDLTVFATKQVLYSPRGRRPVRDVTDYRCTGPDGVLYQNHNKRTLTELLRRRYGKDVQIEWLVREVD